MTDTDPMPYLPQSVIALTDPEWEHLAHLCHRYLRDTDYVEHSFPRDHPRHADIAHIYERRDLCERIIAAVES